MTRAFDDDLLLWFNIHININFSMKRTFLKAPSNVLDHFFMLYIAFANLKIDQSFRLASIFK